MGIEDIDILKDMPQPPSRRETEEWMMRNALSRGDRRDRENGLAFPDIRAYVFVPDSSSSTCADAALKFRRHVGLRSMGFYTASGDWAYGINLRPRDMLCFYHKEPLIYRGKPLEQVFLEMTARKKLMLVLEAKDCYEIMEAR